MESVRVEFTDIKIQDTLLDSLERNIALFIKELKPSWLQSWEISILICTDKEIQTINRKRRSKDSPTDVLSFPLLDMNISIPHQMIGELIISWDTTITQAEKIGHSVQDEFYRLLVHGILHLFGYDHETNQEDELKMKAKEDELLNLVFGDSTWD